MLNLGIILLCKEELRNISLASRFFTQRTRTLRFIIPTVLSRERLIDAK